MRDHCFVEDDGTHMAVADLPTPVILELLQDGVDVFGEITEEQFLERLRIELVAREIMA